MATPAPLLFRRMSKLFLYRAVDGRSEVPEVTKELMRLSAKLMITRKCSSPNSLSLLLDRPGVAFRRALASTEGAQDAARLHCALTVLHTHLTTVRGAEVETGHVTQQIHRVLFFDRREGATAHFKVLVT